MDNIRKALADLRTEKMCLIYLKDQNEVSLIASAEKIDNTVMAEMKRITTSDILITVSSLQAKKLGLDLLSDLLEASYDKFPNTRKLVKKPKPWALPVDHINVLTGSSDNDKLLTIHRMAELIKTNQQDKFLDEFNAPGHLRVFVAAPGLLTERKGHTELSIALMQMAGLSEIAIISSMKDLVTDERLSTDDAIKYAQNREMAYLEESEVIDAYNQFLASQS